MTDGELRQNRINDINNMSDLLIYLKDVIKEEIYVSSLAYFDSVSSKGKNYQEVNVRPFPLSYDQEPFTQIAYNITNSVFEKNEIVLLIYADKNFVDNLSSVNLNISKVPYQQKKHLQEYAIVIPLKNKSDNYSREREILIGDFDGKKIYQKSFKKEGPFNSRVEIDNLGSFSEIVSVESVIRIGPDIIPNYLGLWGTDSMTNNPYIQITTSGKINLINYNRFSSSTTDTCVYITVKYIK